MMVVVARKEAAEDKAAEAGAAMLEVEEEVAVELMEAQMAAAVGLAVVAMVTGEMAMVVAEMVTAAVARAAAVMRLAAACCSEVERDGDGTACDGIQATVAANPAAGRLVAERMVGTSAAARQAGVKEARAERLVGMEGCTVTVVQVEERAVMMVGVARKEAAEDKAAEAGAAMLEVVEEVAVELMEAQMAAAVGLAVVHRNNLRLASERLAMRQLDT
jgi:hypothetical protein